MHASSSSSACAKRSARQPKPSPPSPIVTRSNISVVMPTPQPPSTGPTSAPASRWTSSRKTSLKCASPEIWRSGRTVTPSASIGTTNIVRPLCLGTSAFVRASSRPNDACWAFVVQTFWPESRQEPSGCCLARVWMPARSEPAAGSENSWHQTSSAVSIGPRWRCFWSSEPCAISVGPSMPTPMMSKIPGTPARPISWLTTTCWSGPRPAPPYSAGHVTAASPPSASSRCQARRAATERVVVAPARGGLLLVLLEPARGPSRGTRPAPACRSGPRRLSS